MGRNPLGVFARARGDHAQGTFGLGDREDPVERTTVLERPGPLEVLELEPGSTAEHLTELLGRRTGRQDDVLPDPSPRPLDLAEIQRSLPAGGWTGIAEGWAGWIAASPPM
jgi:hypothetical protein